MTWRRGVASGVAVVAVAFVLLVYVPNLLLSKLSSFDRSGRVAITTIWFTVSLVGLLWVLRRLQSRHLI